MKLVYLITIGLLTAQPVVAGERQFIAWWKSYDEQIQVNADHGQHYRKKIDLNFDALKAYRVQLATPFAGNTEIGTALVLSAQKNYELLLVTPKNILTGLTTIDRRYYETMKQCAGDRSWLVVLPQNRWSEIDLNPYCTMAYDESAIQLVLYWAGPSGKPLVDVVTNGLACVPHHLYAWDRRTDRYLLKAEKCTGERTALN